MSERSPRSLPRAFRSWLPNAVLAAASLVASILVSEGCVRLLRPQPIEVIAPGLYQPDPPRRYRLTPGYRGELTNLADFRTPLTINSAGLRGEDLAAKTAGERRLLVLGDSFVFGWGVGERETFVAQLEALLATEQPGWRTINGGIPGFGPPDAVDWLDSRGLALEPDAILLAIFLGNDLLDATSAFRRVEMVEGMVGEPGFRQGWRFELYRRSHLVRLLKRAIPLAPQIWLRRQLGISLPWSITALRQVLETYAVEPTVLQEEGRALNREKLLRLRTIAHDRGLPVALVLLPARRDVVPTRWTVTLAGFDLDPAHYRPDQPARIFSALADELGLPVLDLSPAFRAVLGKGESLYFANDPHWTAAGNRLAARELCDFVARSGLIGD